MKRFFEYLFFKYYNWAIKVGDGDIPSTTSVMCISFGITLYCIDIAMAYSFFIAPQSIVSNVYKFLFPSVFPLSFVILYCNLVIKGKDKQIMENYKEVWIGRKHWSAILFPVIAFLVFAIELYIKILMNRSNYTPDDVFGKPLFDRGFTGHEHLTAFGLVNMNGRMYDPVTSSFLSPDRYVPYDRYRLAAVV